MQIQKKKNYAPLNILDRFNTPSPSHFSLQLKIYSLITYVFKILNIPQLGINEVHESIDCKNER